MTPPYLKLLCQNGTVHSPLSEFFIHVLSSNPLLHMGSTNDRFAKEIQQRSRSSLVTISRDLLVRSDDRTMHSTDGVAELKERRIAWAAGVRLFAC